ncbi:MAG: DUF4303 domain-containing protein [Peptococcaceae bacterium]|nr:DUF4303 domain-containing protein [Peptococcaceae bacterium]
MDELKTIKPICLTIEKGYRIPHDIEKVAQSIYTFCLNSSNSAECERLISLFLKSVKQSRFEDIFERTAAYLFKLANSEKLLYEEFFKAIHLYDSLKRFSYLGLTDETCCMDRAEECIRRLFSKYPKWAGDRVKELRKKTKADTTECKKALAECNNDVDQALAYMRKKGLAGVSRTVKGLQGLIEARSDLPELGWISVDSRVDNTLVQLKTLRSQEFHVLDSNADEIWDLTPFMKISMFLSVLEKCEEKTTKPSLEDYTQAIALEIEARLNEIDTLAQEIVNAAKPSFLDLFSNGERYYYCTLTTSGEAHPPTISAWSWEALDREAQRQNLSQDDKECLKWSYSESPYFCHGEDTFNTVRRIFYERPSIDDLTDADWVNEYDIRLKAMELAMKKLDGDKIFELNQPRNQVVINAEVMPPDGTNTARAKRLNNSKSKAMKMWLREAAEPD